MAEPVLIGQRPPAIRRDRMVQTWILASAVSWMGNAAWQVGLAWVAVRTLSPAQAGLVITIATIPQALLTLVGGVVADRFDTRRVMIAAQLGQAAVLVVGALLWTSVAHLPLLVAAGIAEGVFVGLSAPASATLGRQLVVSDDLATVSGWNQISARLARLAGAPIGAAIVGWLGLPAVMVVDAVSFVVVAASMAFIVRPRFRLHGAVEEGWLRSLGSGLDYLRRDRTALVFLLALCGLNIFSSPVTGMGVPLRITDSGWPAITLGAVEAVFSACAIGGSLLAIRLRPRRKAAAAFATLILQGAAYGLVAVPSIVTLALAMALIGLTAGFASVWLSAEFVRIVQPAYLGRAASLSNLGDLLLVPVAAPAFGALTAGVGIQFSLVIVAVLMMLMCGAILARRDIRAIGADRDAASETAASV
ncbi:MFS transporter [Humibacter ginsenosidimutans]|uniref:MFS transporter n=1 Tax=Humibacter ginsenosidimutans TaxID=2599293 RepID=A0A5B8M3V4_9MICO|nr:MFS transporter [Humibacter ginsenosidimutans]QDZ14260.1 MFS transporter [Humibacter ginsenosidimutans]